MRKGIIPLMLFALTYSALLGQQPIQLKATNSRLKAFNVESWDGTQWNEMDSSTFSYSGNRGAFFLSLDDIAFDSNESLDWDYSNSTWTNSELQEKTFDNEGNMLTLTVKTWDTLALNWKNVSKATYTYDSQGNTLSLISQFADSSGVLINAHQLLYTYDAQGNMLSYEEYNWQAGAWKPWEREVYTYSATNKQTSKVIQRHNTTWYSRFKYVTEYTANDDIDTVTYSVTNPNTGIWGVNERTFYTYDANFNVTVKTDQFYYQGWNNERIETNTYNGAGKLIHKLIVQGLGGHPIENLEQHSYTYDAAGLLAEHIHQKWQQAAWSNWRKYNYEYDAQGNELVYYMHTHYNGLWEERNKFTTTYNSYNQPLTTVRQYSGTDLYYLRYYYEEYDDEATGIASVQHVPSSTYPNPFDTNVAINFATSESGTYTFEVFNLNGQRIYTQTDYRPAGAHSLVWEGIQDNGNAISSGIYFYRIGNGSYATTGKLVKE